MCLCLNSASDLILVAIVWGAAALLMMALWYVWRFLVVRWFAKGDIEDAFIAGAAWAEERKEKREKGDED